MSLCFEGLLPKSKLDIITNSPKRESNKELIKEIRKLRKAVRRLNNRPSHPGNGGWPE